MIQRPLPLLPRTLFASVIMSKSILLERQRRLRRATRKSLLTGLLKSIMLAIFKLRARRLISLRKDIQDALVPKYYVHANVVVLPTGRYAYIGGEINPGKEGRVAIVGQMTLTGLIDTAGGFNAFANRSKVRVTHVDGTSQTVNYRKAIVHPELDPRIYPGDRIYIPRRF